MAKTNIKPIACILPRRSRLDMAENSKMPGSQLFKVERILAGLKFYGFPLKTEDVRTLYAWDIAENEEMDPDPVSKDALLGKDNLERVHSLCAGATLVITFGKTSEMVAEYVRTNYLEHFFIIPISHVSFMAAVNRLKMVPAEIMEEIGISVNETRSNIDNDNPESKKEKKLLENKWVNQISTVLKSKRAVIWNREVDAEASTILFRPCGYGGVPVLIRLGTKLRIEIGNENSLEPFSLVTLQVEDEETLSLGGLGPKELFVYSNSIKFHSYFKLCYKLASLHMEHLEQVTNFSSSLLPEIANERRIQCLNMFKKKIQLAFAKLGGNGYLAGNCTDVVFSIAPLTVHKAGKARNKTYIEKHIEYTKNAKSWTLENLWRKAKHAFEHKKKHEAVYQKYRHELGLV